MASITTNVLWQGFGGSFSNRYNCLMGEDRKWQHRVRYFKGPVMAAACIPGLWCVHVNANSPECECVDGFGFLWGSQGGVRFIYAVNFTFFIHWLYFIIQAVLVSTAWPSCFCLSLHNCIFDWDDKLVLFLLCTTGGFLCRTEMFESRSKAFGSSLSEPKWFI